MTGRQWLSRRVRWVVGASSVTVGVALTGAWFQQPWVGRAALVAFLGTAVFGQFFLLPCPWCRANLGRLIFRHESWLWGVDRRAGSCPHCGTNLDDDVPGSEPVDEHDRYQTDY